MFSYFEFFAGGGMVRAGLGDRWSCAFANDIDPKKAESYARNWSPCSFRLGDIARVTTDELPGQVDLAWASFPCQDLSLAGGGAGLAGARSGTFWAFWRVMAGLRAEGRAPSIVALENVVGALSSHGGRDFAAICEALMEGGYRVGALVIDARLFVPQSRPRLVLVALDAALDPGSLVSSEPASSFVTRPVIEAHRRLSDHARDAWLWWRLPEPPLRNQGLADLVENEPTGVAWRTDSETKRLLAMMNPIHRAKLEDAKRAGRRVIGALYRRTRPDGRGGKEQRAEVRFDDIAGCLRTPAGGSSRQTLLEVCGDRIRSRLLSPREAARLMGLDDDYALPERANEAYHLLGDGVVVPVVRHLAENLFEPIVLSAREIDRRRVA